MGQELDNNISFKEFMQKQLVQMTGKSWEDMIVEIQSNKERWNKECSEEAIRKSLKKVGNKQVTGYERLRSWSFMEYFNMKNGNKNCIFSKNLDESLIQAIKHANNFENLMAYSSNNLLHEFGLFYQDGKVFNINESIKLLSLKTDIPIKYSKDNNLPFRQIFFDLNELRIQDDLVLFGLLCSEVSVKEFASKSGNEDRGKCLRVLCVGIDESDGKCFYAWDYVSYDGLSINRTPNTDHFLTEDKLDILHSNFCKIALNLIRIINNKDVEIINTSMKSIREARLKKGRLGLPDRCSINLTGKLKRYINEITQQNEKAWEFGHRFWVRGHWKEWKHKRYKNKQGQKTLIAPYIKGRGELINKDYYIGEKEQCWENEKQMIKIIRSLYPENEVKTHNRTILEGLEIDCYIPELKLGFEYNGKQHYEHIEFFHKTTKDFEAQKNRDIEKLKRAEHKGIKIITIRYDEAVTEEVIKSKLISKNLK